jgi:hypothetical protein
MRLRSAVVCFLVGLLAAPSAGAQDQSAAWRSFTGSLAPGSFVVVHLKNGTSLRGHLTQVTADTVGVLPKTRMPVPVRDLAFSDITSIDVRKEGMSPGSKVLIGIGVAGGVILLAVAVALRGLK